MVIDFKAISLIMFFICFGGEFSNYSIFSVHAPTGASAEEENCFIFWPT